MSHRRRRLAVLATAVSLLLAGAPMTAALPDHDAAAPPAGERLLAWIGHLGGVVAQVFGAAELQPSSDPDLTVPVPSADPQSTLETSPNESEAGPVVDPDG